MTHNLRTPLREALHDQVDEATLQRMWQEIDERRRRGRRSTARLVTRIVFATAAAVAAVVVALGLRGGQPPSSRGPAGPLAAAQGEALATRLDARGATAALDVSLSDASRLRLEPGARLTVGENTDRRVALVLEEGVAHFDVAHRTNRHWSIDCGLLVVDVTGTSFTLDRSARAVTVEVQEGTVQITSDRLQPRVQQLLTGGRLTITAEAGADAGTEAARTTPPTSPSATASTEPVPIGTRPDPEATKTSRERSGLREGPSEGRGAHETAVRDEVDELLASADAARISGRHQEAAGLLLRVIHDHRRDPRAAIAAFTLGRLQLEELGDARTAAASFELALDLGIPKGLAESALARRVEAYARAREATAARRAAAAYRERFPDGPHLKEVDRWAD